MAEKEDPVMLAERLFEQARRFTDSWLGNVKFQLGRQGAHLQRKTHAARYCQVQLLEVRQKDALALFNTANPAFNKLAALIAHLVEQLQELHTELDEDFCPRLLAYGEEPQLTSSSQEGDVQVLLAKLLPFLRELASLLDRLGLFLENLLLQLGSLCAEHTRKATILQGDHARLAFLAVATSLSWLLRVEIICSRNPNLASAFAMFTRMLQAVASEVKSFEPDGAKASKELQAAVSNLQERVMGKGVFRNTVDRLLVRGSEVQLTCSSASFTAAASGVLREELASITTRIAEGADRPGDRDSLIGILALGTLVFSLGEEQGAVDKKLLRLLLNLHQQVPLLPVYSELMLQPASFLSQYLPTYLDAYIPAAYARQAATLRMQQLDRSLADFSTQLQHSALAVAAWVCSLDSLMATSSVTESLLTQMAAVIVRGLALASQTRHRLLNMLGQLKLSNAAIGKSALRIFIHAACEIKAVERAFQVQDSAIAEALPHLVTHVKSGTQGLLSALGATVRAKSRQAAGSQSLLSVKAKRERAISALQEASVAIDAASDITKGPVSSMQLSALSVCLEAVETSSTVPDADLQRLQERVATLRLLTTLPASTVKACSCSFLFYNWDLLEAGLRDIVAKPEEARKLPLLVAAFADGHCMLAATSLDLEATHQAFDEQLVRSLKRQVMLPLCNAIETQLRLHHHASQVGPASADTEQQQPSPVQDMTPLLRLEPIRLLTRIINLRDFVERELSARFYDHTAVALYDWQTYSQLALLAKERLGLNVQQPDLPGLIVDPGLDLMDIMREMPSFTAGYAYSLVSHTFIQRAAADIGTKHLMTLGLAHVANALRKHGASLADAVVNAAYHLLTRQFAVMSQWLCQDEVKSRLSKELRSISEALQDSSSSSPVYPFFWAETLTADLRRLGATADGLTYSDHLRRLVTEIGNTMALVRLVQQGKARQQATAAQYLRQGKGQQLPRFREAVQDNAGEELLRSADLLDSAVKRLASNHRAGPDYNSVLISIFSEQRSGLQNSQMATLYAVVPALTLNAVEAGLLAKEQLPHRRIGSVALAFTDDGFAMGLAFLLKVLGQEGEFASIRWFASVEGHFAAQQAELETDQAAVSGTFAKWIGRLAGSEQDDSQTQNRELARARSQSYAAEFKLLRNVYSCAQLLYARS